MTKKLNAINIFLCCAVDEIYIECRLIILFLVNSGPVQARRWSGAGDPAVDRGSAGGEVPGGEDIRGLTQGI